MSFELKQAELSAGRISYHVGGSGKPVLHLHPAGGVTMSRPLQELTKTHQVFAPVAPGFDGTGPIASITALSDYVGLVAEFAGRLVGDRFDVIGSSFGSWVALWLAARHPKMVDHLILEVPAGFRFGGKGGLPVDPDERMKALYAHPERLEAPGKPAEIMAANRQTYERLIGGVMVDEELSARLASIEAVTLILLGTEDPVVPPEAGAHLKRHIPASQRVFVYDAAHSIAIDQPERVFRLWSAFLERGPGFVLNQGAAA
ncbi:alpha/beta hydrolase [Chelativorans sp.]|uniref:alpha/beta fold hydrolase n=1 Tax=Chelativorans sp. TaxID=2203393 RepID=UPI0028120AAC|nr:alpha/beta hydrolase [Chelativorans sp.]